MLLASTLQAGIPEPGLRVYGTIAINGVPVTATDTGIAVEARRTPTGPAIARYAMGSQGAAGNFYSLVLNAETSAPLEDGANVALGSSIHLVVVDGNGEVYPVKSVIAGSKAAVDKACEVLKSMGAKRALLLPVSAPFHSSLMKPAAEKLREKLATLTLGVPQIPVLNNIDVAIETDADRIRDALYRQAFGPVRWVECVQAIKARGVTTLVECGPGKVLAGMTKRIDAELTGVALYDPATLAEVKGILA
jgi:[acyl-carrier-protein] S-malonyltransferase